ncbi:MAG: hydrogenase nickel incorporation protein HypB [Thermodesulfobacteriota bacterium]|nr:hydrogenase nickel incorporation protein HypB [Thermodesulfobacteriota bacterium]
MKIPVIRKILEANDHIAEENRKIFAENGIFVLNLMSSPGAGKTSLLERTIDALHKDLRIGVIEGDVQTSIDAKKISKKGVPTVQINTDEACHLDGNMIRATLDSFDLKSLDLLIIENVGNLVCPAEFDTGENHKVVVLSIPEGDDKPAKYPLMFHESKVLLINKIDLVPYVDCSINKIKKSALKINPDLEIFEVSCKTQEGLSQWYEWIKKKVHAYTRRKSKR